MVPCKISISILFDAVVEVSCVIMLYTDGMKRILGDALRIDDVLQRVLDAESSILALCFYMFHFFNPSVKPHGDYS